MSEALPSAEMSPVRLAGCKRAGKTDQPNASQGI